MSKRKRKKDRRIKVRKWLQDQDATKEARQQYHDAKIVADMPLAQNGCLLPHGQPTQAIPFPQAPTSNNEALPVEGSTKTRKRKRSSLADDNNENGHDRLGIRNTESQIVGCTVAVPTTDDQDHRSAAGPIFPFSADADDHCETPLEAYQDIVPLLQNLTQAAMNNNSSSLQLKIYDPYYCDGSVIRNLATFGFRDVYNQREDCYEVWASDSSSGRYPSFDVLITNPPYSGDHIEKLLLHVTSTQFGNRPWFLLLPQWVHKREYFTQSTANIRPFYLVPRKRYIYVPPKNFRLPKKSDVHKKSSPFVSMWYIWGGSPSRNEALIRQFYRCNNDKELKIECDLARSKSALRDLRRKQT